MAARLRCCALFALLFAATGAAQGPPDARQERLAWWRQARFGMFVHWGLYAIPAGEGQDGSRDHGEWIRTTAKIPLAAYEELRARWNPVKFDARQWARLARDAGMRYVVITSKHHDGFCLFDSQHTDWDVGATPFRRDVLAELAPAVRAEGLQMCWYHSIMDWHHPDYLPRRDWEVDRSTAGASFPRFVDHLRKQVTELLTNYGPIGVMWFDGEWEPTWNHEYGQQLYDLCRKLQPDVIVNNRVDVGRDGMAGFTRGAFAGDFGTPEQEIPARGLPGVDWESCITMNEHWGYNRADQKWKSSRQLIRMLCEIASKGGNFLLNVGPTAAGEIPEPSVERLAAIGRWMRVHGAAIHGTQASPFRDLAGTRCTMQRHGTGTTLYLHVFERPADGQLVLPGLGNELRGARWLGAPDTKVTPTRREAELVIPLPATLPDADCSVLALEIDGAPVVYEAPEFVTEAREFVAELAVELRSASPELQVRTTTDGSEPKSSAAAGTGPLVLRQTTTVKARAFHGDRPVSGVAEATFTRVTPRAGEPADGFDDGLLLAVHHGDFTRVAAIPPDLGGATVVRPGPVRSPPAGECQQTGWRLYGHLCLPADAAAIYTFALGSDDGSRLTIGGQVVVDNDGLHGARTARGRIALGAGCHPIVIEWFNRTGDALLDLGFTIPGTELRAVPGEWLKHRR